MGSEAEVLYDMSKEFEIVKEQCLFQQNLMIDSNNQIYMCVQDKIYVISIRKIALNKCILQDVIDCTRMVYNSKDKTIENHFVDEITHMYNSKVVSSQEQFASFVLKDDRINMMNDQLLRQRLVTINNDILSLKIKNFRISKYGLIPANRPIITILLSNGDAYNIGYLKSGNEQLMSYQILNNEQHIKLLVVTGKSIIVIHLLHTSKVSNNGKMVVQSDNLNSESVPNNTFKLIEIKYLDHQFVDRIYMQESPRLKAPIIHLAHNQELVSISSIDYSVLSKQSKQTFGGSLGKILAVFQDNTHDNLSIFNEKSQIEIQPNQHTQLIDQSFIKMEQDVESIEIEGEQIIKKEEEIQSYSNSMFLPYGVVQSVNQSFCIVCGAHSFTSQQITNILIINDSANVQDPQGFLAKCIKNLEKSVYYGTQVEGEVQNVLLTTMPFNWDDVLFYILKNQNEFVDILKISLLIYDQQKGIKKFSQDPQLKKFIAFLNNLNVPTDKLSFINEKILLFLTSMQRQQFKDFIYQQKQAILSRNFENAYNVLKKNHSNSQIFKRIHKEVNRETVLQNIMNQSIQNISDLECITCIITHLEIVEEPILKCKNCKHFMIDLDKYLKIDPSNSSINISNTFSFRNNICPLCCGLTVPLLQ